MINGASDDEMDIEDEKNEDEKNKAKQTNDARPWTQSQKPSSTRP